MILIRVISFGFIICLPPNFGYMSQSYIFNKIIKSASNGICNWTIIDSWNIFMCSIIDIMVHVWIAIELKPIISFQWVHSKLVTTQLWEIIPKIVPDKHTRELNIIDGIYYKWYIHGRAYMQMWLYLYWIISYPMGPLIKSNIQTHCFMWNVFTLPSLTPHAVMWL